MNKKQFEPYSSIPTEKFRLVEEQTVSRDVKLDTKPHSYMYDAFLRFCKNKGAIVAAIVIIILVLFSIIAPFCTPYNVSDQDIYFGYALPKSHLFKDTDFWDGCKIVEDNYANFIYNMAISTELNNAAEGNGGHNVVKNQKYEIVETADGVLYKYRYDTYHKEGTKYLQINQEEYALIQEYQNKTGNQVLYPTLRLKDRPAAMQNNNDANYYYVTKTVGGKTQAVLDSNGNVQPIYWEAKKEDINDGYNSIRIEGQDGFEVNGETHYYVYARRVSGGDVEVRLNYYEYYTFRHSYVLKDGISEPYFLFGATQAGKDILACLSNGARFSFIFAISIALVNMVIGAIYGAIEGYYGGAPDLIMERISDILSAVPMMIVITLLKYYMKETSTVLVLFLSFIVTGWIGMASTVRMQFYRYKNQEYVLAARTLGAKDWRVIWKHVFPNSLGTLVTSCALVIPSMIFSETSLSYLGIINLESGNITSVGTLIATGQQCLTTFPHVVAFPSIFLALLMLSFNLFGNGLRDAFNPTLRGSEG